MIEDYLLQTAEKKVLSNWPALCDDAAAASMVLENNGPLLLGNFYVKVTLASGQTGSGTVVITGIRSTGSVPQAETLTFSANGSQRSVYAYKPGTVTSITTTGLVDEVPPPNVRADACDSGGVILVSTTWESFDCRWEDSQEAYFDSAGAWKLSNAKVMTQALYVAGDTIRKDSSSTSFPVKKVQVAPDLLGSEEYRTLLL